MITFFIVIVLASAIVAATSFMLSSRIHVVELAVIVVIQLALAGVAAYLVSRLNTDDVEVWNGSVVEKHREAVPCAHSYPCNCTTTCSGGKNNTCTTTCQTCWQHSVDYDWVVVTSNAEVIDIDRIDSQGSDEPPRFTSTKVGDLTAVPHTYTNYVKGAPGTLFKRQGSSDDFVGTLPDYPKVYDYYHIDRYIVDGKAVRGSEWAHDLTALNSELGKEKEVNVILVIDHDRPVEWYYALEEKWLGGKQNDVILVVSLAADSRPQWAQVMTWSKSELLKVALRDAVMDMPVFDRQSTIDVIRKQVSDKFERRSMEDFKYLSSTVTPTTAQWVWSLIAMVVVGVGLSWFFHAYDPFEDLVIRLRRIHHRRSGRRR